MESFSTRNSAIFGLSIAQTCGNPAEKLLGGMIAGCAHATKASRAIVVVCSANERAFRGAKGDSVLPAHQHSEERVHLGTVPHQVSEVLVEQPSQFAKDLALDLR